MNGRDPVWLAASALCLAWACTDHRVQPPSAASSNCALTNGACTTAGAADVAAPPSAGMQAEAVDAGSNVDAQPAVAGGAPVAGSTAGVGGGAIAAAGAGGSKATSPVPEPMGDEASYIFDQTQLRTYNLII